MSTSLAFSSRRWHCCRGTAYHRSGCLFVLDEDEPRKYRHALRRSAWSDVRIVNGVRGVQAQRSFIVQYFPDGARSVPIDDDITDVMWKHKPGQHGKLPNGTFEGPAFDAFNRMATYGSFICGFHSSISCQVRNMRVDGVSTPNGEVDGCQYFFLNRHSQALLPTVEDTTEDAERTLRVLNIDGNVLRYRVYCGVTSCCENLHGILGTCTRERRKLVVTVTAKRLHELFPTLAARPVLKRMPRTLGVKFLHTGGAVIPSTTMEAFRRHHASGRGGEGSDASEAQTASGTQSVKLHTAAFYPAVRTQRHQ